MIVNYFCVEDAIANEFGPLFPAKNLGVAKRMFKSLLKDVDSEYYKNYFLHFIGTFDAENGLFVCSKNVDGPSICGSDFLEDNDK